jgi:hypothetical protein
MRLFLADADGSEITAVNFDDVRTVMNLGGSCTIRKRDKDMALIGTIKKLLNQRVEIRKDDGTTVIWEGLITDIDYHSKRREWIMSGPEGLRSLDDVACGYNGDKGAGIVTTIDIDDTPPMITDKGQTFDSSLEGCEVLFTNKDVSTIETQYPHSDTGWINNHPAGGGIAADTTSGAFGDLAIGGVSNGMFLEDQNERGADYYALEVVFQFAQHANLNHLYFVFQCEFGARSNFAENGSDCPRFELYDDDAGTWQTADGNGVVGLGRKSEGFSEWGGVANGNQDRLVTIDATDLGGYLDANGKIIFRITCGGPSDADIIKCFHAYGKGEYSTLYTAEANAYTIDIVNGSTLTFTGQTPYADQVRATDTFRIGQDVETILNNCWRDGLVNWLDLELDGTTGIVDCTDLRSTYLGPLLRRYAEQINWNVWQEIGWNIRFGNTYDPTNLSLTQTDFKSFHFGVRGRTIIRKHSIFSVDYWAAAIANVVDGIRGFFDSFLGQNQVNTQSAAEQAVDNMLTKHSSVEYRFEGLLDMTGGAYDAIGLGEKITITLWTDKVVITDGVIDEIVWIQKHGGHLYANIKVII